MKVGFLMHRVELKGVWGNILRFKEQVFLMHRVELKVVYIPSHKFS